MTHRYAPRYELTRVLASLWSVTRAGSCWIARCSLHKRGGQCVTIIEGPGQHEATLHCAYGCAPRDILDDAYNLVALRRMRRRRQRLERAKGRQA